MQRINIIPTKLKKEIKMRTVYNSIKKLFFIILIFTASYGAAMISAEMVLETHLKDTLIQSDLITTSAKDYVQKVKDINEQINQISEIQASNVRWSELLEYINRHSDKSSIQFNKISIDQNKNTLTLNGRSGTRKDLLSLKESLESNKNFTNINFPIKNLLEKENINFDISLTIKSYEFSNL